MNHFLVEHLENKKMYFNQFSSIHIFLPLYKKKANLCAKEMDCAKYFLDKE